MDVAREPLVPETIAIPKGGAVASNGEVGSNRHEPNVRGGLRAKHERRLPAAD